MSSIFKATRTPPTCPQPPQPPSSSITPRDRTTPREKRLNSFTSGPPSVRGGSVRLAELEENDKEMAKLMEETRKIQQVRGSCSSSR